MAVKGKGKQVASSPPRAAASAPGAGKRGNSSGEAGPSSGGGTKRRRRSGVLQFFDDDAYVAEEDEEELLESEEEADYDFVNEGKLDNVSLNKTGTSHALPFLVKEEQLSGDELEEFIKDRYGSGVKYAADDDSKEHDDITAADALKEPVIWRVKCMIGRERQMAFCFMQKFVDLNNFGTKLPIISAFALDHVRGFVFVEAEKAGDVTEACKGFCSVYASRISAVPTAEVPSLLSSRTKPFELSVGTWVRMKSGNYKGDLAQVVSIDDGRKRAMVKLIPRVDLQAISKKFGGAIPLKQAAVPAPRLISPQELDFFRPHIEMRRDRQTGDVFEVLDGLMFKDGYLYKRVAVSSLIYWGIQPTETELLKFSSTSSSKTVAEDLDWVSSIYGPNKKNLPRESNVNASTSREKPSNSKASNFKSSSIDNFDDDFNLHDLVLFGRKDFGVIVAVEKDGFKILKGDPEGSSVTVRKQDIKKGCIDKMFTAVDHKKKIISIGDTVKVLEGPSQGKQGVVKHLYKGILFLYDECESENNGFFCAKCETCENVKKRKESASSVTENLEDDQTPVFAESPFISYEQNEQRETDRPRRSDREQLFSIGQTLRIRKGPLKGYLCRVVRIFRNDVTVKLDSLVKIITVEAQFLSVPTTRGVESGVSSDPFGGQDVSLLGSQAEKTSWDHGLPSFGSDSWQPFSSSTLPTSGNDDKKAGGESDADPWCKKASSSAGDGESDADPWCKKTASSAGGDSAPDVWGKAVDTSNDQPSPWNNTSNERPDQASDQTETWNKKVEVWSSNATQKCVPDNSVWAKQTSGGGSDNTTWAKQTGGNWGTDSLKSSNLAVNSDAHGAGSWDSAAANKDNRESDNWGQLSSGVNKETATSGGMDPWGSKIKEVASKETDSWGKTSMQQEKTDGGIQGWAKSDASAGAQDDAWGKKSSALEGSHDDAWGKEKDSSSAQGDAWGKSKEKCEEGGAWNKAGASHQTGSDNWDKPKSFGGDGFSSWNKGEEVNRDNQSDSWSRPRSFEGGRGFGRGRGRGRGRESGDSGNRDEQGSWKRTSGNDNFERPSWRSASQGDDEAGDSGGYRGRGRGRGQYGGRGRGRDNWRNGGGMERSSGDKPSWTSSQQNFRDGDSSDWNKSTSNNSSCGGGDNWNASNPSSTQPWSSNEGTKSFTEKQTSTWNSSAEKQSCGSQEQEADPWASKVASTPGAEDNNDAWNAKGKDASFNSGHKWGSAASGSSGAEEKADAGGWNNAGSSSQFQSDSWSKPASGDNQGSSWSKPAFRSGEQDPGWNKPRYDDDNPGNGRGGFGRGNRGRGRGRNFSDRDGGNGSSWGGGRDRIDESEGNRSGEGSWNRQCDFGGGRGRGRSYGQGGRNQDTDFRSGGRGGGWGSACGNKDQDQGGNNWNANDETRPFGHDRVGSGGGWSRSSDCNNGEGKTGDQAGKSQSAPIIGGSSASGKQTWDDGKASTWGAPSDTGTARDGDSWGKGNEDSNPSAARQSGASASTWEKSPLGEAKADQKEEGSWGKADGTSSQSGAGSAWDQAGGAGDKGGSGGNNGW